MPIPPQIILRVVAYFVQTAPKAYRAGRVVEKYVVKKYGKYFVEIERRAVVGTDGGISQVVRFLRGDITQEAWHIVVKAGKIIHKHILE